SSLPFPSSTSFIHLSFFTHPPPTDIYTLSLHDALPISTRYYDSLNIFAAGGSPEEIKRFLNFQCQNVRNASQDLLLLLVGDARRSEEHTSELQSLRHLVCRLLLEKKKKSDNTNIYIMTN